MEEIIIEKGDYINRDKIIDISFDRKGQIILFCESYEDIGYGEKAQIVYRIKKGEENDNWRNCKRIYSNSNWWII